MCGNVASVQSTASFRGSPKLHFRPIQPSDASLLREFFRSHSKQTILYRYFAPLRDLSAEQIEKFVRLDYSRDVAIVGLTMEGRHPQMICVGRYFLNSDLTSAEIAITVHDDFQRHGIGTFLLRALIKIARSRGLKALTADLLADNHGMMRLLRKCAPDVKLDLDAGVYHASFSIEPAGPAPLDARASRVRRKTFSGASSALIGSKRPCAR